MKKWELIKEFATLKRVVKFRMWPFSKHKTPKFQVWIEHRKDGKTTGSHLIYKTSK